MKAQDIKIPECYSDLSSEVKPRLESLWGLGNIELISSNKVIICVVGTRKPNINVRRHLELLFELEIDKSKVVLLSGLALGVDSEVHKYAITNGYPTIAVVAGGIDIGYPRSNQNLYESILNEGGLILSEFPEGVEVGRWSFPLRNRIMALLSNTIFVVQSPRRSGTLITAQYGLELGKDVAVVPGSPLNESCRGSNSLLGNGAIALNSKEVVYDILRRIAGEEILSAEYRFRIDLLGYLKKHRKSEISMKDLRKFAIKRGLDVNSATKKLLLSGILERLTPLDFRIKENG